MLKIRLSVIMSVILSVIVCMSQTTISFAKEQSQSEGWYIKDNEWHFYVEADNHDISDGWEKIDGVWYGFQNNSLACNEWVDGYYADKNGLCSYDAYGTWVETEKGWYFMDSNGWYPKSEGQWIDGFYYEFDNDGYMITNGWGNDTQTPNMKAYYNSEGHQVSGGMKTISGKTYRFYTEGTGHQKYSFTMTDKTYDDSEGWHNTSEDGNGSWYYAIGGNIARFGWKEIDGCWYYFDYGGFPYTSCWKEGYYLDDDGKQTYPYQAKWSYDYSKKKYRYSDSSGWYATGDVTIDSMLVHFDEDGYTDDGPGLPED